MALRGFEILEHVRGWGWGEVEGDGGGVDLSYSVTYIGFHKVLRLQICLRLFENIFQ